MKICLISNLFPPHNRGGAEQVVLNTLRGLKERGHEVIIITAGPLRVCRRMWHSATDPSSSLQPKAVIEDGVKVYRFFPLNLFFYGHDYRYPLAVRFFWHILDTFNLHSYFLVKSILKKEKPDVVHTHNLKGIGYLIPLALRSLGLRHIHTLHDVQLVNPSGIIIKGKEEPKGLKGFFFSIYARVCRFLFGSPEVIVSPSKFLLGFYKERGFFPKSNSMVIPNPVVVSAFSAKEPRVGFNFLYLGQIEEHKGVLFLIENFKKTMRRLTTQDVRLYIVGHGSKIEEAKNLARDSSQIIFLGKVSREDLPSIFNQTDLMIVPSLCYENSPTVIFESFSYGVPVLASDIEGVAELIKDGVNGFTFATSDSASLTKKLIFCLENREKIDQMREAARASVDGLDLNSYLDKVISLYEP